MKDIQPLFNLRAEHGESPVWNEEGSIFYWMDLLRGHFHKVSLRAGAAGKKIEDVLLPVQFPTSCCFGGEDLSTLLLTTSALLLNEKEKKEYPLSGRILACETGTKGQPMRKFKG